MKLSDRPNKYGHHYYKTDPDQGRRCTKSNKRVTKTQHAQLNWNNAAPMGVCPECGRICTVLWNTIYRDAYSWEVHFRKGEEPIGQRVAEPVVVDTDSIEVDDPPF